MNTQAQIVKLIVANVTNNPQRRIYRDITEVPSTIAARIQLDIATLLASDAEAIKYTGPTASELNATIAAKKPGLQAELGKVTTALRAFAVKYQNWDHRAASIPADELADNRAAEQERGRIVAETEALDDLRKEAYKANEAQTAKERLAQIITALIGA